LTLIFFVAGDERYPIILDFGSFCFPHDNLPPSWLDPRLAIPDATEDRHDHLAILVRDGSCRLTAHSLRTESAHLVPPIQSSWFHDNAMFRYGKWTDGPPIAHSRKITPIEDPRNLLLLRSDIRALFDVQYFYVVPKRGVWVCHVPFGGPSDELAALYHNVELQPLTQVAIEFLLARFAWCIFGRGAFILPGPVDLTVSQADRTRLAREHGLSDEEYMAVFGIRPPSGSSSRSNSAPSRSNSAPSRSNSAPSRSNSPPNRSNSAPSRSNSAPSRSNSPGKRAREGDVPEEDEDGEGDETDEEDELRGRPRKRRCEEERLSGVDALPSTAE
jgi:hypothetical protein